MTGEGGALSRVLRDNTTRISLRGCLSLLIIARDWGKQKSVTFPHLLTVFGIDRNAQRICRRFRSLQTTI